MKIGLIDVDGHNFPNLALMRLASFHRSKGDEVEWVFPFARYDRIYRSKVFTFTPDDFTTNRQPTAYERDLARWANRAWLFKSMDFEDFRPRKGFCCKDYLF